MTLASRRANAANWSGANGSHQVLGGVIPTRSMRIVAHSMAATTGKVGGLIIGTYG